MPIAHALFGMPVSRVVIAGVRLGIFERLAREPATTAQLAADLGLQRAGTEELVLAMEALGHVRRRGDAYELAKRARRWLDPSSELYLGSYIEHCVDYWEWWGKLETIVRTGEAVEIHDAGPDDAHWRRYIRGQFELARLSGPEVAKAIPLPPDSTTLLDVAGGHGWFSVELCRRHPGLNATVLDLPGSAAIGREIIDQAGMSDRVRHLEGDALSDELGGPYDAALCFNLIHHLSPEENERLFGRLHAALRPGGTLAVLDLFRPRRARADTSAL
ncbi:MAG TPA: class I SAM-dependent methyltransferase, partial [Actinomycetota bacterium]